jgi:hypothetical protein
MSDFIEFLNTFVSLILFSVGVVLVLYPLVVLRDVIIGRKNAKKRTESDSVFMMCVDCGTTENVNEVGLCSFCEEDREQQEEGEMNHE